MERGQQGLHQERKDDGRLMRDEKVGFATEDRPVWVQTHCNCIWGWERIQAKKGSREERSLKVNIRGEVTSLECNAYQVLHAVIGR